MMYAVKLTDKDGNMEILNGRGTTLPLMPVSCDLIMRESDDDDWQFANDGNWLVDLSIMAFEDHVVENANNENVRGVVMCRRILICLNEDGLGSFGTLKSLELKPMYWGVLNYDPNSC